MNDKLQKHKQTDECNELTPQ